jgi:hypothetical protein
MGARYDRLLLLFVVAASGCTSWMKTTSPSGIPCSNIEVIPYGQKLDRPHQSFAVVKSDPSAETDMERIMSLRKDACYRKGGDAVIEAATETKRTPNGDIPVATGMAVRFLRSASKPTAAAVKSEPNP